MLSLAPTIASEVGAKVRACKAITHVADILILTMSNRLIRCWERSRLRLESELTDEALVQLASEKTLIPGRALIMRGTGLVPTPGTQRASVILGI
jgi:hypothetical protein